MSALSSQPTRSDRVRPAFRTLSAALAGIGAAILGFFAVSDWEARSAERSFRALAQENVRTLQHSVDHYVDRLVSLRGLFYGAEEAKVSRRGFEIFSRELIQDLPGLLSLSWSPRVLHSERTAHERAAQADGIAGYRISTVDAKSNLPGPQEKRADYYPIFYGTMPYTARAYGIDLQDGGVRQRPLDKARDLNAIAATENFRLQSRRARGYEFYAALPVYRPGAPYRTLEERRANILGFVRGTFQFQLMVDSVLSGVQTPVDFYVFEAGTDGSALPIYARRDGEMSGEPVPLSEVLSRQLNWVDELRLADRSWNVVVVPSDGAGLAYRKTAWIVLGAGNIVALLIAAYVWTSARYVRMLEDANSLILEQAHTDPLTGLSNRRHFVERLTDAFAAANRTGDRFAVHFLDLDGFKSVNDTYGHPMGDALLKEVANRIFAHTRMTDIAARFGGDEFAVLQSLAGSPAAASVFAEKLVEALGRPYWIEGAELHVTASLGIALQTPQTEGPTNIMMQADLALYSAKAAGRDRVRIYNSDLGAGAEAPAVVRHSHSSAA
jgi:diguanylate cyclase (GGDEF)-like protein